MAQKKIAQQNKPGYDDKKVHYGFYLAAPLTKYEIEHSESYVNQLNDGNAMTVNAKLKPGFYTGLVLNVGLAQYLDFRFVPGVGFYGRTIEFDNAIADPATGERSSDEVTISSTMVELPFLLKYKAKRRGNFRMYLVGGVKPGMDLGSRKDTSTGEKIHTEKYDVALEYGFGVDIFYPYFKFAPEIRFSHGLVNQHKPVTTGDYPDYSQSIQRMTNHNVSFILFFE
ncbi:porin family protein [Pontibacter ruber]|uniref:Porin family protein n=1 Tax=Pontibacter ruber TaxID=1343895 RepID=A0ABW5D0G0_9BACT|nr:porin family protein [Pontibacter ruber]